MIDQDKMRALAKHLREDFNVWKHGFVADWATSAGPAADAIDLLLAEVETAAADKRDKPTLEMIRAGLCVVYPALYKESLFSEFDGPILRAATERRIGIMREQYKAMVDAALAQRKGERS